MAGRWPPSPYVSTGSSICVCVLISSKDISYILLEPTPQTPFYMLIRLLIHYWIKANKVDPLCFAPLQRECSWSLALGVTVSLWILFIRSEKVLCALFALKNGEHEACLTLEIGKLGCLPHRGSEK